MARYSSRMRTIGRRVPTPTTMPHAAGLQAAAAHQLIGSALAAIHSTGIAKGVYRFKSPQEADEQRDEALARVIAANALLQRRGR